MAALAALARLWACAHPHYGAAPKLADYPERHPIKTMRELLAEMMPALPVLSGPAAPGWEAEARRVLDRVLPLAPEEATKVIDEELAANRAERYEARLANVLWDLRDLFANTAKDAPREEINAYAQWRVDFLGNEKRGLPPSTSRFSGEPPAWYGPIEKAQWIREREAERAEFDRRMQVLVEPMERRLPR
jgi:hypothetical protein